MTELYDPARGMEQVCAGLKRVAFDPIPDLNGYDYPPAVPVLDAGVVVPPPINYQLAMRRGAIQLDFQLHLMVGSSAGHEQQKSLWQYMAWAGDRSIVALVDANRSLGIVGTDGEPRVDAHVAGARALTLDEMPAYESMTFGVAFELVVVVTNKE